MAIALQIIGKKKSGKTTTMLNFIEKASEMRLSVAAFKHTHHSVSMDVEGTDTYRFSQAGANQVGMQNDYGFFWHEHRPSGEKVSLMQEIQSYVHTDTDLILIEGFKTAGYPKLLLLRPEDRVSDFEVEQLDYVGSLYQEKLESGMLDFSSKAAAQSWFEKWYEVRK
ncbi:molybdopterin-guanine dinucleotide biosynthesis protein B [Enterococcus sp. AZ109]|uniref:molybdopterin-guanine dinucleotide biosynthesis protein B n=1 Tax=Enterococcus sp. AZ109 TaxID=2774634 RepID=UPI003F280843